MGFAAVAQVTDDSWTACAVQDDIGFGLLPGGTLDIETTLYREVRAANRPLALDRASVHPVYSGHPTPMLYGFESYVSVPIVLPSGGYFGNLCAIDPKPADVDNERVLGTFQNFAQLIAFELDAQERTSAAEKRFDDERTTGALREEFIAVLAHDLRNPLSSIAAAADVLRRRRDDPLVLDLAVRIARNANRIKDLVDDLLDFARGRLGAGMQLKLEPISDLQVVLDEVIDELRSVHPHREIRQTYRIDVPVHGDRSRLQQLASNVVANAVTHGVAHSPITVEASAGEEEFVLRVHNEGDPIPHDLLPRIFEPYARGEAAVGREGIGLGLYICKQIAQAHRGTIAVSSSAASGTEFIVRIPRLETG